VPTRPWGIAFATLAANASGSSCSAIQASKSGVAVIPGATALTRTLSRASSTAAPRVIADSAPFVAL
jgi:hypothetical protein